MNCEIYVNGSKLDLFNDESINIKYIKKDAQDITKVFAPFSKGFSIPATPKNLQILNFFGDTSLIRSFNSASFDCKIYLHGILNKEGILKIENVKYKSGKIDLFNVSFNSKLTSLQEAIGKDNISDLGDYFVSWRPDVVRNSVQNTQGLPPFTWYTPLISLYRVWEYNSQEQFNDNIFFRSSNVWFEPRVIRADELRPAVNVVGLLNRIKEKYNLNFNIPLESRDELKKAFIWCNGENFGGGRRRLILNRNYSQNDFNSSNRAVVNTADSSIDVTKAANVYQIRYFLRFENVLLLDKEECNVKITLVDKNTGRDVVVQNAVFTNGRNDVIININYNSPYSASNFSFYTEIESSTPLMWESNSSAFTFFRFSTGSLSGSYTGNATSNLTGLHQINLLRAIPETSVIDFLKNLIKTFNISIFESSDNSGGLEWLTPVDVENQTQNFGFKELDYTPYVSKAEVEKKVLEEYNFYNFKHKESKYRSNVDFKNQFGVEYGQATFPTLRPEKSKEFVVETGFSIIPPVTVNGAPNFITAYGFTSDTPTVAEGRFRYTPNKDELTLLFNRGGKQLPSCGIQNVNASGILGVASISQYQETTPLGNGGVNDQTLLFSIGVFNGLEYTKSLFQTFYSGLIERLLNVNTLEHIYEFNLPNKELVFNQGQTIQPNGFRLQNKIIIQEEKFEVSEMDIDLTTGKAKAKLINI